MPIQANKIIMNDQRKAALDFLMTQKGGVVSTVSGDQPQSAFVYYEGDEDFSVYFVTTLTTRKYKNIQSNKKVSFTVATIKPPQTIQLDGMAEEVNDVDKVRIILANYMDTASSGVENKPPVTKLEWEKGLIIYRIKPTWLRWSSFIEHENGIKRFSVILIGDKT